MPPRVTKRQREILEGFLRSKKSGSRRLLTALFELLQESSHEWVDTNKQWHSFAHAINPLGWNIKQEERRLRRRLTLQMNNLKHAGYVRSRQDGPRQWSYALTDAGKGVVLRGLVEDARSRKKPDGILRLLVFDVPEGERGLRDRFRGILQDLGFEYCQKSVWISKYPIENELKEVIELLGHRAYVRVFYAREFSWDPDRLFDPTDLV